VQAAKKALTEDGRSTEAATIERLFTKSDAGAKQFYMTLALARVHDAKSGKQTDVTDVLAVCLESSDKIKLADAYFVLADKLQPNQK
jgi:hypothetical protein